MFLNYFFNILKKIEDYGGLEGFNNNSNIYLQKKWNKKIECTYFCSTFVNMLFQLWKLTVNKYSKFPKAGPAPLFCLEKKMLWSAL